MAKVQDHSIHLARARAALPVRHEPYWRKTGAGHIGYRKHTDPAASFWVARWLSRELQIGKGARRKTYQRRLGLESVMTYAQAEQAAHDWFTQCETGAPRPGTVAEACRAYVENQRIVKSVSAADFSDLRFKALVYSAPIGRMKLDELRDIDVTNWRNGLLNGRQRNSANRDLRGFKAALNFARRRKLVGTDAAWVDVEPFKGPGAADRPRTTYLTPAQRRRLLDAADQDTATLLRGLLYTAARPLSSSELPVARVADFDPVQATLTLRNYKGDGTERVRHVPLSTAAVAFLRELARSKLPGAYLFTRHGQPWRRHQWAQGIAAAVRQANAHADPTDRLPLDTCAYTMRHCAITDRLRAGESLGKVAKDAGTSVAMIEQHYAKYISDADTRAKLDSIVAF